MTKIKSNQSHGIKTKKWTKFISTLSHLSDGEIIIYLSKQLFILEKNQTHFIGSKSHHQSKEKRYLIDIIIKKKLVC